MSKIIRFFLIALLTIFILFGVLGGVLYLSFRNSPFYSLQVISKSVQENDIDIFEKYVDIEEVSEDLSNIIVQQNTRQRAGLFGQIGEAIFEPLVADIIASETRRAVKSGDLKTALETGNFDVLFEESELIQLENQERKFNFGGDLDLDFWSLIIIYINSKQECTDDTCNEIKLELTLDKATISLFFQKVSEGEENIWRLRGLEL